MIIKRSASPAYGIHASAGAAAPPEDPEPALHVATVYQDPLTRYWATELWGRVGELISRKRVRSQSWRIDELANPRPFADAVKAAAEADVLVISVRDAGDWPASLHVWIDSWLPKRAGREGALVALIGVPGRPDSQSGRAHQYLATVARKAGLDFLPRERKLPATASASSGLVKLGRVAGAPAAMVERPASPGDPDRVRWKLKSLAATPGEKINGHRRSPAARRERSIRRSG